MISNRLKIIKSDKTVNSFYPRNHHFKFHFQMVYKIFLQKVKNTTQKSKKPITPELP